MRIISLAIVKFLYGFFFLDADTNRPEVDVLPKRVAGMYGDRVCFSCTTTHEEAHWRVENETIEGITDGHRVDEQLVVHYCLNVTRNVTVTCHGETPSQYEDISGTDIGEVTLIGEG